MKRWIPLVALLALAACGGTREFAPGGLSLKTQVLGVWKDPKYALPPLKRVFVVSLMKVEPGGRDAVEDAIVARLASAGVTGIASHTVMSQDAEKPGPTLEEAIKASGADGVLLVEVRAVGVYDGSTVGQTVTGLSPDTMASYKYLAPQTPYKDQSTDYKVAHIASDLYPPSMAKQMWTLYTNSYDAADLVRNLPDFTRKLVETMARDRIIPAAPKPA
ncbi:MAG: hypothetical protein IT518_08770 [Burkholderiales bacterium]|nr:hypothetical protein [Burkholderiales bacterium]